MMRTFLEYLKNKRMPLALGAGWLLILIGVLVLYGISVEPVLYGAILCFFAGLAFFLYDFGKYRDTVRTLRRVRENIPANLELLGTARDVSEGLYMEIIRELDHMRRVIGSERQQFYTELTDYYSMWVHQIKTPIAALKLLLDEDREKNARELDELFKIEQYVEMVLGYLRTEEMSSDMSFREYSLDEIVREQVHRYIRMFVGKRLSLAYEGVEARVLTDRKWLGFVIGQILSNALKYTSKGKISIYMSKEAPMELVIEDTGIGIRPEDLPRVFERGYTGYNGRGENTSSGIGLYLSGKIVKKLGHAIRIESVAGKGTKVFLDLSREEEELY